MKIGKILDALLDARLPAVGVKLDADGVIRVDYDGTETAQDIIDGNALVVSVGRIYERDVLRRAGYGEVEEQLDKLWHDIDNGIFGEGAKLSTWYIGNKAVKAENPVE